MHLTRPCKAHEMLVQSYGTHSSTLYILILNHCTENYSARHTQYYYFRLSQLAAVMIRNQYGTNNVFVFLF